MFDVDKTEAEKKFDALLSQAEARGAKDAIDKLMAGTVDKSIGQALTGGSSVEMADPVLGDVMVPKEITAARFIKTSARGASSDRGAAFAKEMYPHDKLLAKAYNQKALGASIPSDGGITVPQILASEIIMPLYTKIGVTKLGGRRVPLPNGNMTLPRIDTSATVGWIGENQPAGVSQQVTGDTKLNAKKLGVITPISNDLLRSADIAADQWVLDDIRNRMFVEMDRTTLYGLNTQYTPGGLATLLPSANIQGSSSTAFTTTLISTLYGLLGQANVQMISPGIIINAVTESYLMNLTTSTGAFLFYQEMMQNKTIRGIPYAVSNNASYTSGSPGYVDFFIGDWSEFIVGTQGDLMVETSREGSYESGGSVYSALSRDQTIIRVLSLQDYAIRHTASFIKYTAKLATS